MGTTQGAGGYGALGETIFTLTNLETLKFKLLESPHLYTMEFKLGIAAYIAGELGIIPAKYGELGKNIAIGGAIAAVTTGGPHNMSKSTRENAQAAPTMAAAQRYY